MIDYEKLKEAHELGSKLPYEWWAIDATQGTGTATNYYRLTFEDKEIISHEYEFNHDEIDDLIAKLKDLMGESNKMVPKYEVGQTVWISEGPRRISSNVIDEIDESSPERYFLRRDVWYTEGDIYPSREALIDAQIEYWTCLKTEEKSTHEKYMSKKSTCDHLIKMNNKGEPLICEKCGADMSRITLDWGVR